MLGLLGARFLKSSSDPALRAPVRWRATTMTSRRAATGKARDFGRSGIERRRGVNVI
jgi:hypothetical protein